MIQEFRNKMRRFFRFTFYSLLPLAGGGLVGVSCSDFLEQESENVIYADKDHLHNATDTIYSVTGIMNKLQVIADRTILLGEMRGDLVDITSSTSADLRDVALFNIGDDNVYNAPRDYYAVINNCNYFLAKADTALKNNRNEYIFMKEYAAVKAFRAWTYLQLVLNYGAVPFVTEPILTKADAEKEYPIKGIQEACNILIDDIAPYANIEQPTYGAIRNTDSRFFYFPINVLLGDLNLWAGNYRAAALAYYRYISTRNGTNTAYPVGTNSVRWSRSDVHWENGIDNWSPYAFTSYSETYSNNSELITMIPGDSIPSEGNYSLLRNLFNTNSDNLYHSSIIPSQSIINLSAAQKYCHVTNSGDIVIAPANLENYTAGDLRLYRSWSNSGDTYVISNDNISRVKDYSAFQKYTTRNVHVYRRTMVYLRLAEALNRAGFPRFAFQILKTGVNNDVIDTQVIPYYPDDADWLLQFDFPNLLYVLETQNQLSTENTMGIHSRGSGFSAFNDSYSYPSDDADNADLQQEIEAVEDLIMDEEALEFAFEGHRFYDLMRVALRRNNPAYLANRIYQRRGADKEAEMHSLIQTDLYDTRNWYLNWNNKIGLGY